jgi:hypothetical protein
MKMSYEVWMRLVNTDTVRTKIDTAADVHQAIAATLEKYNLRIEDVQELRVKRITK